MHALIHFVVVAGVTIAALQGGFWLLDKLGVPVVSGFGWDDVILGTATAAGVTLAMMLVRPMLKAA